MKNQIKDKGDLLRLCEGVQCNCGGVKLHTDQMSRLDNRDQFKTFLVRRNMMIEREEIHEMGNCEETILSSQAVDCGGD